MGTIFSKSCSGKNKKSGGTISDADRAILDLKIARDKLRAYQAKLSKESETLTQQAVQLLKSGKRDRALLTVKFKRFRQDKIREIEGQLLTVEKMVNTIEWETRQATVIASLKSGTDALNAMHAAMSLESIQDLLEESKAAQDKEQEISNILSQAPELSRDEEDAVQRELAELEEEQQAAAAPVVLPVAPTTDIKTDSPINHEEEQEEPGKRRPVAEKPQREMVAA